MKVLKKYFSVILFLSLLLSVTHHHNDLKQHNDCKICTLQSNISNVDTPLEVNYLSDIDIIFEKILFISIFIYIEKFKNNLHQRAPPFFS